MAPFFSVIIPTYNRASMLPKAIESVLRQTLADWELIIIDDGSTDSTKEVVVKFSDLRIRYIYQANAERCAARNNGVAHATGRYICFLDSDDYYLQNRLECLHDELVKRNFPVSLFYTGLLLDREGIINKRNEYQDSEKNIYDRIALSVIHSQQVCIHREILQKFKYDIRFHIGEDMELWLRIAEHYPLVYLDNQFTVVTVEHEGRTVNIKRNNTYVHQLRLLQYVFSPAHPGRQISANIKANLLSNCYFGIAKYCIYNNLRGTATLNMVKSIFTDFKSNQLKFKFNVMLKLVTCSKMGKIIKLIDY